MFSENLFIGAVDLYILISSFFLCNTNSRKIVKVFELGLELVIFRVAVYLSGIYLGKSFNILELFSCLLPVSYYVVLYSVLYLISPYINNSINQLSKKQLKRMAMINFLIFSVWSYGVDLLCLTGDYNPMSSIGMYGSNAGYTIVNFVMIYILGAALRKNYENKVIKKTSCVIMATISLVILFFMSLVTNVTWNYNNPIIIVMIMAIFAWFTQIKITSRAINELSRATFTCFLINGVVVSRIGIEHFVNKNLMLLIAHQIGTSIILYLVSYLVYKVYRLFTKPVITLFEKVIGEPNIFSM